MKSNSQGLEIKQILYLIRQNWPWFIVGALVGLLASLIYNKATNQQFQASSSILIKTEDNNTALKSLYKDLDINEKSTSIQNQIAILSSYDLNLRTLENLHWDFSWYEDHWLNPQDLSDNPPYSLSKPNYFNEVKDVPILIRAISPTSYSLSYDAETTINGKKVKLQHKTAVDFGKPFINDYFNFTLTPANGSATDRGKEYILQFNDPREQALGYEGGLDIKLADKDAEVLNVKINGDDPSRLVEYLNALGQTYILFGLSERDRMADNTVRFIDSLINNIDSSLQTAGNQYSAFRSKNKVLDFGKETSLVIEKGKDIDEQTAEAKIKLDYYGNLKKYLNDPAGIKNLVAPSVVGITDPSMNNLVMKLSDLFTQREVQSYTLQEKNPRLEALDKEIKYTQRILLENINNLLSNTRQELNSLSVEKAQLGQQQATLPKIEQNFISIKRNFDLNSDLYNFLMQRRTEAGIVKASNEPDATIIDPATSDTVKPIGHHGGINLLIGAITGIVLAFLIILLKKYLGSRIRMISDVLTALDVPLTAIIRRSNLDSALPAYEYAHSAVAESFRDVRTKIILHWPNHSGCKVISVNSCISKEGKSFVSSNLACMMALDNKKVLLVDMDLRKPDIHSIFKVNNKLGMSNYLKSETTFENLLVNTIRGLTLITAGSHAEYPSELLHTDRLNRFFDLAKKQFDYVIIKNPPSMLISDSRLIDKYADLNLFLLKFKYSARTEIAYINELAKINKQSDMFVILNNVSTSNDLMNMKGYGYYHEEKMRTS